MNTIYWHVNARLNDGLIIKQLVVAQRENYRVPSED